MRVTLVSAVFLPEPVVSARITKDLGDELAKQGHAVTILCPRPSRPLGAAYPSYPPLAAPSKATEGLLSVVRLPSYVYPRSAFLGRMRESCSFGRHSAQYVLKHLANCDVVYANTWPLPAQAALARAANRLRRPFVLHVQDIYPEALASKLPGLLAPLVLSPLRRWDRRIARRARKVVLIGEASRRYYQESRSLEDWRVEVAENWQDETPFFGAPGRPAAAQANGVDPTPFTFLYLGNMGPATDLETVIRAFQRAALRDSQLLLIGDGSHKQHCAILATELGLRNIRFLSCPSFAQVPGLQSLADVCLLPLRQGVALAGVPSKVPAYMFSAKPVLALVESQSDTARCLQAAGCGWVGESENVEWLAGKMAEVAALPRPELEEMGRRGRAYGLNHFSKASGVRRLAGVILAAARPEE